MNDAQPHIAAAPAAAESAIPRDYNFAADILKRNLDAGRGNKLAYIDRQRPLHLCGTRRAGRSLRPCAALARHPPRGAHPHLSPRQHRLADRLPRRDQGRRRARFPVNTLMTETDYRFMLRDSRARLLVVSEALFAKFADAIRESDDLEHVIVSGA